MGYSVGLRLSTLLLLSDTSTNHPPQNPQTTGGSQGSENGNRTGAQNLASLPVPAGFSIEPSNSLSVVKVREGEERRTEGWKTGAKRQQHTSHHYN